MLPNLLEKLQFNTLRTKIIFAFIIVGLIPFLIFATFSYHTYSEAFYSKITTYSEEVVNSVVIQTDNYLLDIIELFEMKDDYYINQGIKLIQANEYQKNRKYIFRLWEEFNKIIRLKQGLNEFSIRFNNGQILSNFGLYYSAERDNSYYQDINFNNQGYFISTPHYNKYEEAVISIVKPFNTEKIKRVFLSIHFNIEILKRLTNLRLGQQGYIFIINKNGKVIYHPEEENIGQKAKLLNEYILKNNEGSTVIESNQKEYVLTFSSSELTDWKIISVADTTQFIAQLNELKKLTIIGIISILIALTIMIFYLSFYLTRPLKRLERVTEKAVHNNFNVDIQIKGKDEIAKLGKSINKMMSRIRNLVKTNIKEQKHIRELEVKSLYEQIKPHFIYNTLDMIIGQLEENNNIERASYLIESLGKFFRLSFAKGKEMVLIKKELDHIRSYLDIQKFRFMDKFDYLISIEDPEIKSYFIPKLLLQPLIENSIYHGVLNRDDDGLIIIKGYKRKDYIIFKIINNGPGINQNKREEISNILKDDIKKYNSEKNYGIYNVNKRIKYKFGEKYGLYLEESTNNKTVFRIEIGIIEVNEEND